MKIMGRDASKLARAARRTNTYKAVGRTFTVCGQPVQMLSRYLFDVGVYPWSPTLNTATGQVTPTLYSQADVLTVNEIFCRHDYGSGGERVVVDLGGNIGLAALFFLTARPDSVVYSAEPVPRNIARLRANLADFDDRFHLDTRAVSTTGGEAEFLIEATGRLGGLAEFSSRAGQPITVDCVPIADYLEQILDTEGGHVDLLKVDTEGSEGPLIAAIPVGIRRNIGTIVWEDHGRTRRVSGSAD
jgi:FkbM family methyltransferase